MLVTSLSLYTSRLQLACAAPPSLGLLPEPAGSVPAAHDAHDAAVAAAASRAALLRALAGSLERAAAARSDAGYWGALEHRGDRNSNGQA